MSNSRQQIAAYRKKLPLVSVFFVTMVAINMQSVCF